MNADIRFYWSLVLRRLPLMALLFILSAGIGLGLAVTLPSKYMASAQLLVESPQIPENLATSTVATGAAEQLQVIEQRLMTRSTLIDIAHEFDIFDDSDRMNPDEIVNAMRRAVAIRWTSGRDRATLMSISFEHTDPALTARVVNELVTKVLNEDVRFRTARAGETLQFFEDEVERLSTDLAEFSSRIVDFKSANKDALPDGQEYRLTRQGQLQDAINLALRDRAALNEQRNRLVEMFEATGALNRTDEPMSATERELRQAERELGDALTIYSDTNPRVKILQAKVKRLETMLAEEIAPQTANAEGEAVPNLLDLQLGEIDTRIGQIDDSIARAQAQLDVLNKSIEATPENAIRLEALEREYATIEGQYNQAISRLSAAQTGERIEVLSKGARMTVIEQASIPSEPTSPNRKKIAAAGIGLGGALAVGFFVLIEFMSRSIRRPSDLTRALNIQPLATVPYLETSGARMRRRTVQVGLAALVLIGTPLALWAIHEFYAPLDYVFGKVLEKLGI